MTSASAASLATLPEGEAPQPWQRCCLSDDVDEHASSQPDWTLRYEQLSAGAFRGSVQHIDLVGLRLVRETANRAIRQRGMLGVGACGVAVPSAPAGNVLLNGQRIDSESIMVSSGDDLDLCTPACFELHGVVFDHALVAELNERNAATSPAPWFERQVAVRSSSAAARLRACVALAFEAVHREPTLLHDAVAVRQLRDTIVLECVDLLPETVDASSLKSAAARRRVVERACEIILAEPSEPVSMLEVCRRIGASRRKLSYCFQDVLGASPARYLRLVRLNSVRRALKAPADRRVGVQDIATRWGFWHFGQFSTDYKRQFSELPSQTLARARGALPH